jgi:hypothetical protein
MQKTLPNITGYSESNTLGNNSYFLACDSNSGYTNVKISKNNLFAIFNDKFEIFSFALSDATSDLSVGMVDVFHWPYNCILVDLFIAVGDSTIRINNNC